MSTKANPARIGLFVILAVILFIAGLLAFGARSYFVPKNKMETAIPGQVYGLSVGSSVQLRGVPIGKVTRITFAWNVYPRTQSRLIVVEFEVEGGLVPLPHGMTMKAAVKQSAENGLRAMVKSQGITGTSILALEMLDPQTYPPPAIDYTPRYLYIPSAPPQLTRLVDSLDKSLRHLQELDFGAIGESITNTLAAAQALATKLGHVDVQALSTNANALLLELRESSAKLTATIDDVHKTVNKAQLDAVSQNANNLLTELRTSNVKLQTVLDNLGTAPMHQTVTSLQQTLQTLNEVLLELKRYPSGFIFGKPPRPVEALEPEQK